MKKSNNKNDNKASEKAQLPGNPVYSADEDIYNQEKKVAFNEDEIPRKGKQKPDPSLDDKLDIPGAELDDADEKIGREDEENNYYSLGGDGHNDLDEDKGE